MRPIILRTQAEVLADLQADVGDTVAARWSTADIYRAINIALQGWAGRVKLPRLYDMPSGFSGGIYEYSIPDYVGDDFRPYIKAAILDDYGLVTSTDTNYTWAPVDGWVVEPTATGGRKLRLIHTTYTEDARLIWYASNGPVPTAVPKLNTTINSTDTSAIITTTAKVDEVGWVKLDSEWVSYAGISRGATTTTLQNLVRGLFGTTAASHTGTTADAYWGIAVDDERLWEQLMFRATAHLHFMLLHRGTMEDRGNHEKIMGYAMDQATRFWRQVGYVPTAGPRLKRNMVTF